MNKDSYLSGTFFCLAGYNSENAVLSKLKYEFNDFVSGGTPKSSNEAFYTQGEEGIPFVNISDFKDKHISDTKKRLTAEGVTYKNLRLLESNRIMYAMYASVGKVNVNTIPTTISQAILSFTPNEDNDLMYTFYLLESYKSILSFYTNGTTQNNLNANTVKNLPFIKYSKNKQVQIVDFLNHETSHINKMIDLHNQGLEMLEISKQSLINEVMSKGIDKTINLINNDVPWFKEYPETWEKTRLKTVLDYVDIRNKDSNAELLSIYTSIGVKPRSELEERGNKNSTVINYKMVEKDDFIVNRLLSWMGAMAKSNYRGVTSPDYDIYRVKVNRAYPKYIHYLLKTDGLKYECYKYGRGIMAMRWRTYPKDFLNIKVPLSPLKIQKELVRYLDIKLELVNQEIEIKKQIISKLKQAKGSLIYEAVTGKIKI